ncbi:efflux RND transporter periplasmic adaptor subunit [Cytobacillus solani]|uniref:efflux RND transporter periplasmic adaptor subunit n=1 Tax=Cytobacillus solani TaxID=1637975 RepID=UPI00207926C2|nr:efflux RND transporter periplasmic adaptor subunit [Cytobacillus solani]USK54658.1 efflux RND transporter periplasmic adaptor subunit [Cytobacillus solani]
MRKHIKKLLVGAGILFISGNIYLILKDQSKIERSAFVDQYSAAKKEDIKEMLHKEGVVSPSDNYHYYYDEKMGSFKQFFVKKGEEVTIGTPLYEYISADIEADRVRMEAEITKIENQISAIEDHISELTRYRDSLMFEDEEKAEGRAIIHSVEQDIYDKELQAEMLGKAAEKYEQELEALQASEGKLTVVSEYEGIVSDVNVGLENPLITINSLTPTIQGSFNEEERLQAEAGMTAILSSKLMKNTWKGTLQEADNLPAEHASEKKKSYYPFTIQLDEEAPPDLLQGSHVNIRLITKEVNGAIMVPKESIVRNKKKSFVWLITASGRLEQREIKTGMQSGYQVQVKKGIDAGEIIVSHSNSVQKEEGPSIITPLHPSKLELSSMKAIGKKQIARYIAKGILSR